MKTKRIFAAVLAAAVSAAMLTACGNNADSGINADSISQASEMDMTDDSDTSDSESSSVDDAEESEDDDEEESEDEEESQLYDVGSDYVPTDESNFQIVADGDNLRIVKYTGSEPDVKIPEYIDSKQVIVDVNAFYENSVIKSVVVPPTVAPSVIKFDGSTLEKVVTYTNNVSFEEYKKLKEAELNLDPENPDYNKLPSFRECSSLEKVSGTDTEFAIMSCTFQNCTALKEFDFGLCDVSIATYAFQNCTSLKEIKLGNVSGIGDKAFYGCESLSSATVVSLIDCSYIGVYAFANCPNLKSFIINDATVPLRDNCFGYYDVDINDPAKMKKVDSFTIYAPKYSKAQEYADNNGFAFEAIS